MLKRDPQKQAADNARWVKIQCRQAQARKVIARGGKFCKPKFIAQISQRPIIAIGNHKRAASNHSHKRTEVFGPNYRGDSVFRRKDPQKISSEKAQFLKDDVGSECKYCAA
jgi:hypothetical protein